MLKFGPYLVDLTAGEVRKNGSLIRLQEKPLRVLALLAERQGQLVTREELKKRLWPEDTFVDFETGLNTAVSKLRDALSDSAETPRYIETIPRRGYRFLVAVEKLGGVIRAGPTSPIGVSAIPGTPAASRGESAEEKTGSPVAISGAAASSSPGRPENSSTSRTASKPPNWKIVAAASALIALLATGGYFGYRKFWNGGRDSAVSIAVLPFTNLTGDSTKEYLSDGVTEEMITSLARTQGGQLHVIARTSAMSYKLSHETVKQICGELGVRYALEGSVQSEGERLRVTAQLIRCEDQIHIWADTYDGDSGQILKFESNLTDSVAQTLSLKLLTGRKPEYVPTNAAAHDAYLQGRYYLSLRSKEGFENALQSFVSAISEDPHYARAYAELAVTYNLMGQYNWIGTNQAHGQGKAAALQAVEADPNLADAHAAVGFNKWFYEWDSAGAETELLQAIQLEPSNVDAHHWYAMVLMTSGRIENAEKEMRLALALDPRALILRTNLGWVHYMGRQYPLAIQELQSVAHDNPNFLTAHYKLWWTYSVTEDFPRAWEQLKTIVHVISTPENEKRILLTYEKEGYAASLHALSTSSGTTYTGSMVDAARCMNFAGDKAEALKFLQMAMKRHEGWMMFVESDPAFDLLRSEPEYSRLLQEVHAASTQRH
ncbi:MAG TPA: winged helix-turn-helix domain-containing protein [Candidatus Baltobacteraceae bacterium]|nr:winged helix-turn-helix domain-containing protein [Candidatus Baltobacteraceae bacterium]